MKKTIILIISSLLILYNSTVFAYNDINDTQLSNVIDTLSDFGIINGYDDGSFNPQNNITRAEFAKIITVATNTENIIPEGYSTFADVDNGSWAENYIYIAKSLNIIDGIDENTFSPNSNITYEQAIKMIVAALGYSEEANSNGGYPNGYIAVANKLNIINGLAFNQTEYASRGNIALMIRNALDVKYYTLWLENHEIKKSLSNNTLYEIHMEMNNLNLPENNSINLKDNNYDVGVG